VEKFNSYLDTALDNDVTMGQEDKNKLEMIAKSDTATIDAYMATATDIRGKKKLNEAVTMTGIFGQNL
jgi:hypothetical protein